MGALIPVLCRPPCASGFSPLSLSPALGLKADGVLWQDSARTTLATADGDPVGAWDDASGNARHATQGTASARPTYKVGIFNGKPVLRYDAVDDYMNLTSLAYGAAWTLFLVATPGTVYKAIFGGTDNSPAIYTQLNPGGGATDYWFYSAFGDGGVLSETAAGANICAVRWEDAGNYAGYFNGSSVLSAATIHDWATDTTQRLGDAFGGDICEFILYASALSDANVTAVNAYLKAKWGTP